MGEVTLSQVTHSDDPRLERFSELLNRTFPDPNTVLGLDRIREFLSANHDGATRTFHVLVGESDAGVVVGGSIFSYVVESNCGFSEYLVVEGDLRGQGLGRRLFNARKAILDADAAGNGWHACRGLFIEVDNPERTPADFAEAERETSLEMYTRLRLFEHLGFSRVDARYVQPPLAVGKVAIDYMDLLFAPWETEVATGGRIPAEWIFDTVAAIWSAWTPRTFVTHLAELRSRVTGAGVALLHPLDGLSPE